MTTPRPRLPKPQLVIPTPSPIPGSTPDYARGLCLGAISVRRAQANDCRRIAMDAGLAGDESTAFRLHFEADQAEAEIERLWCEIGGIR